MTTDLAPLDIASLHHGYRVAFHRELSAAIHPLLDIPESVCIVDRRVAELHREELAPLLGTRPTLHLDALETTKSLDGAEQVVDWMLEQGCTRSSTVIAIGGGGGSCSGWIDEVQFRVHDRFVDHLLGIEYNQALD